MTCARCGSADARFCSVAGRDLCERDELLVHERTRALLVTPRKLARSAIAVSGGSR